MIRTRVTRLGIVSHMPKTYDTVMDPIRSLRAELDKLLAGGSAHADFDHAVAGLPIKLRGVRPEGAAHSAWEILEHLRIAQWDMLEFSRNPKHKSPAWPEGYWPRNAAPDNAAAWNQNIKAFRKDLKEMRALIRKSSSDLFAPFPHGEGQTLLREALQLADHNAYHLGELVFLRRILGAWE